MESRKQKPSGSFVETKRPCMDQPSQSWIARKMTDRQRLQLYLCSHASKSYCCHLGNKMTANGSAFVILDLTENNRMPEAQIVLVQSREQQRLQSFRKQNARSRSCIAKKVTDCHMLRQSNSSPSPNILPNEQIIVTWVPIPL